MFIIPDLAFHQDTPLTCLAVHLLPDVITFFSAVNITPEFLTPCCDLLTKRFRGSGDRGGLNPALQTDNQACRQTAGLVVCLIFSRERDRQTAGLAVCLSVSLSLPVSANPGSISILLPSFMDPSCSNVDGKIWCHTPFALDPCVNGTGPLPF